MDENEKSWRLYTCAVCQFEFDPNEPWHYDDDKVGVCPGCGTEVGCG